MTDIYNEGNPDPNAALAPPVLAPQLPDEVAELVGPGKKYATIELALKALKPAQDHIAKLEQEARDRAANQVDPAHLEGMYEAVQELLKAQGKPPTAGLDEATVASLVDRQLAAASARETAAKNEAAFKAVFDKQYGEKAKETFAAEAAKAGLSVAQLSDLVRTAPEAALRIVGLKAASAPAGTKLLSSVNTETFDFNQQRQPEKRNLISGGAPRSALAAEWAEITKSVNERNGIK